ncbi:MAG: ATP-binding cassette domain-containing protein, partial [Candidatus Omnitrophica bacterium]|nr:ATP-binding cassette domain-containing protein [Candidatus Omnitrophota bacterium]
MTRTALKEVLLKAEGLALSFRGAPPLLRDACLSLRAGQVTVLTGPTGSGKSLLLKRLANQLPNQKTLRSGGHVHVHGSCRLLSQELRYPEVMQLSVSQWLRKQFSRPGSQRATTCAAGRIRRRQLAEVLRHNSQVLLFDEPLAYLDEAGRLFFVQLLQRLRRERRAVLVVESRTAWLEEVADKWLKLENAKIRERRTIGVSLSYGGTTFTSTLDYVEHTLLVHPHF